MKIAILLVILPALVLLSGCIEQTPNGIEPTLACPDGLVSSKCNCGEQVLEYGYCCDSVPSEVQCEQSPMEGDPVELLRFYLLEDTWAMKELPAGSEVLWDNTGKTIAGFLFENSDIICKRFVMPGIEPKAIWGFAFFEEDKNPDLWLYPRGLAPVKAFYFKDKTLLVFTQCGDESPPFILELFEELSKFEDKSLPQKEIDFLQNYTLPVGWERTELELAHEYVETYDDKMLNPANITFKNPEIICKLWVMPGIDPKAFYTFSFYKKGRVPTAFVFGLGPAKYIYLKNYAVLVYTICGDEMPTFIQQLINELESLEE